MHDFADAVLVFLVLALAFGVAHFLHDHLLGGLGSDAAEIDRRQRFGDNVADLRGRIARPRILEADLDLVVVDQFDDMQITRDMGFAGLGIDLDADFVLAAVAGLGRALHRLFHRGEHDGLVDRLVARDRIGDLQEFGPVGGNLAAISFFSDFSTLARFSRLQIFVDQLVGENELGFRHRAKGKSDTLAVAISMHHIGAVQAEQRARETLAAFDVRRGEFDLRFVPRPAGEIGQPRQRPVDAWRGHFEQIFALDRILTLEKIGQCPRKRGAILHIHCAVRPFGHHLQCLASCRPSVAVARAGTPQPLRPGR